ncbi:SDR family NAD(P)-dependent oxidoreductase [Streptomyces sp. AC602_WCS936]|uniref:SDR family NAD(P)-dependent oxidoreductase n=1 Tax=Streptomyces sp. AC602_WCS936 TaxID=2823685 RepID=UPI001C265AFB|nr:SDR family oxidoreductase [Streptomyces sp. AC602_WCS936]
MSVEGKTLVITGAGTGIGLATAKLAASRGANVVLTDRSEEQVARAAAEIGPRASAYALDVTDSAAFERVFEAVGSFDHLFTCASGITIAPFTELTEEQVRSFFEIKWWGQYKAIKAALPRLAADGSITLVSGYLYRKVDPGYSAFAAVNGAVEATVKSLALELAPLRVNAIAPGPVDTHRKLMSPEEHEAYVKEVSGTLPAGRPGTPEDLAHAALFLMENTFTTGHTLDVDGGKR